MKKVIQYALNQEERLCRFLKDGNIPCDNGHYYLQYLFEQIPLRRARGDTGFMADMMPRFDAYRQYEGARRQQRQSLFGQLFPVPERPRAPHKHGTPASQIVVSGTCSQAGRLERIANAV